MKVALLNTFDVSGGAAVACLRLYNALAEAGIEVNYLVNEKKSSTVNSISVRNGWLENKIAKADFAFERLHIYLNLKDKKDLYLFSTAELGKTIANHPAIQEADVIHLHWYNQGFLSLKNVAQIKALGKPIVWTLHDMWAFTGGCHYSGDCRRFEQSCGTCPMLKSGQQNDLSSKIWNQKAKLYQSNQLTFVTCSNWLADEARASTLLKDQKVVSIPNPIDVNTFKPLNKTEIRTKLNLPTDKFLVLFGAMNTSDERKGFAYLKDAISHLVDQNPEAKNNVELVVFGKTAPGFEEHFPINVNLLGSISGQDKMVEVYNTGDLFVLPSLQDNLPNTAMESLSCGVPVASFNVGGIPQMVEHKTNGYLATFKDSNDLAKGILWMAEMDQAQRSQISSNAREKVLNSFQNQSVAQRYLAVYEEALNKT